ncbi:MAG: hypothetical protein GC164_15050 [Phycisphaera sp.]|nr:hypothetical protein [Phycisphaera sp.]
MPTIRPSRHSERGGVYVAVLAVAVLLTVIGLAAVMVSRKQLEASTLTRDFVQARLNARSGIELATDWIAQNPDWRTSRSQGTWATKFALENGSFSLDARDPVDGNFANNDTDPVDLTATGTAGDARYLLTARLESSGGLDCLKSALLCGNNLTFDASNVDSDQKLVCNYDTDSKNGSMVYGNVETNHNLSGSGYMGSAIKGTAIRAIPPSGSVLAYYLAHGTTISYTSLPVGGVNTITSPGFETSTTGWYAIGGTTVIARDTTEHRSGSACVAVTNRTASTAGIGQSILAALYGGHTFYFESNVRNAVKDENVPDIRMTVSVTAQTSGGSPVTQEWSTPATSVTNGWTTLKLTIPITWTGTLKSAEVRFNTTSSTRGFRVDDVVMKDTSVSTLSAMRRVLLSPTNNPFGSGQANSEGIYILDCQGKDVIVEDCRIVGTLVLRDPGSHTTVQGSVCMEPAVRGYPALMADNDITLSLSAAGLSESTTNTHFNPAGSPYPYPAGSVNTTLTDGYPSKIRGLVYAAGKLEILGPTSVEGVIIACDDMDVVGTNLTLRYSATSLNTTPPGFDNQIRALFLDRGSWSRSID